MIIVRLKGGMGNQMFQYATGRVLSIKNNTDLGLDLSYLLDRTKRPKFHKFTFRNYDLDLFNIKAKIIYPSSIPFIHRIPKGIIGLGLDFFKRKFIKIKGVEKSKNFDGKILNVGPDVFLDGYWQSYKYFEDIKEVIKEDFSFKNKLLDNIKNLAEVIEMENSLCFHVRREDYVNNKDYEIVGKEYYNKSLNCILESRKIDKIYIFSDDIAWCRDNMKFDLPAMFVGDEYKGFKDGGHFFLMSSCRHFIIPNSTFAWWAAWLADCPDKIVIAPKKWFVNDKIDSSDIIPKEWTRI